MPPTRTTVQQRLLERSLFGSSDERVVALARRYIDVLSLPTDRLRVTTDRAEYGAWLGRNVPSSYGGAYCYIRTIDLHAVLINLERIDTSQSRAIEIVVAEELVHMRDHLDGDHRRHAKHGYDRIASRVAELTGASLDEIRTALLPVQRRPYRYVYACPSCGMRVMRKRRGTWSCGRCSPTFNHRYVLRIVDEVSPNDGMVNVQ
jgi:predicted SprT family Zn-dependent metalloprotease